MSIVTKWFYSTDGQVIGPVEQKEIEELLRNKKIAFEDRIYRDGDVKWRPVFEFQEFEKLSNQVKVKNEIQWVVLFKKPKEKGKGYIQKGPFTTEEINNQIKNGQIKYSNYIWKEGMEKWLKVSDVEEFNGSQKKDRPEQKKSAGSEPPMLPEYTKTEVNLNLEDSDEFSFNKITGFQNGKQQVDSDEKLNSYEGDEQTQTQTVELSLETDELALAMEDSRTDVVQKAGDQKGAVQNIGSEEDEFDKTRIAHVSNIGHLVTAEYANEKKNDEPPSLSSANKKGIKGNSESFLEKNDINDIADEDDLDKTVVDVNTSKRIIEELRNIKKSDDPEASNVFKNIEYVEETKIGTNVNIHKNITNKESVKKAKKRRSKRKKEKHEERSSKEKVKWPSFQDAAEFFTQSNVLTALLIAFFSACLLGIFIFIGADILRNKGYEIPFLTFGNESEEKAQVDDTHSRYKIPPPKASFKKPQHQTQPGVSVNIKHEKVKTVQNQNTPQQKVVTPVAVTPSVEPVKPKPPPKIKKEPSYFKIKTKSWNTSKAEIIVETDGTDDYLFVMDVVGRFGEVLGRRNYYEKRYFRKDRSILVSNLNLEPGEYKIIFKYKSIESSKTVFWGKRDKQFKIDLRKFKKKNVFAHHQERAKLIYATSSMGSLLEKLIDNNRRAQNTRQWWKSYGSLKRSWSAAGKSQLNNLSHKNASKYVHFFFWQELKEVKGRASDLLTEISKSSDKRSHPNNAQLQTLLSQIKGFEQRSKKLTIW